MCGICGFYNRSDAELLDRMLLKMEHRGPDDQGTHIEETLNIGMRRLSIIDVGGGHQPIYNEDKTIVVILNGEIYNYPELRKMLAAKGHTFATNSDTEVIVHLYEEYGPKMVNKLRGMFGVCIWDSVSKTFVLIRDRLGIKPVYIYENGNQLYFSSELDSLKEAIPDISIRPQAIAEYLNLLYIPAPETIYEGVTQLLPGEMLIITEGNKKRVRYYDLQVRAAEIKARNSKHLEEEFLECMQDTIRCHLLSDVPLGLFLSGGMDSAAILATMREVAVGDIKTFSIGYDDPADRDFNETTPARLLAEQFGTDHTEELLRPNATELLQNVVNSMGEPFSDSSCIPNYLVSQVAKKNVTVALSGVAGDELLGGYPRYLGMQASSVYQSVPRVLRSILGQKFAPLMPEKGTHSDQVARLKRFLKSGLLDIDKQYLEWVTFLPPEWSTRALNESFRESVDLHTLIIRYAKTFNNWPSYIPANKAMGFDMQTYLPDDLLKMGDRTSMAHSLELRVPFCDHVLLEFALQIPAHVRLKHWRLKGFMRDAYKSKLPAEIVKGAKKGFMLPIARWLREELHEMVFDFLSEDSIKARGYVKPEYVNYLLTEHQSGRRNFSDQIFTLLVLEMWLREKKV